MILLSCSLALASAPVSLSLSLDGPTDIRLQAPLERLLEAPFVIPAEDLERQTPVVELSLLFDDRGRVRWVESDAGDPELRELVERRLRAELELPLLAWQRVPVRLRSIPAAQQEASPSAAEAQAP